MEIAAREFVPKAPPPPPTGLVAEAEGVRLHLSGKSATGYKGVYEKNGRFSARVHNPERNLGTYDTVVQAALAYARAMQETPEPAAYVVSDTMPHAYHCTGLYCTVRYMYHGSAAVQGRGGRATAA